MRFARSPGTVSFINSLGGLHLLFESCCASSHVLSFLQSINLAPGYVNPGTVPQDQRTACFSRTLQSTHFPGALHGPLSEPDMKTIITLLLRPRADGKYGPRSRLRKTNSSFRNISLPGFHCFQDFKDPGWISRAMYFQPFLDIKDLLRLACRTIRISLHLLCF